MVLFPIGIIAAPTSQYHKQLYETLEKIIPKERWRAPGTSSDHNCSLCPGHPIFVYPNLETNNSGSIPVINNDGRVSEFIKNNKETFFSLVEEACEIFEKAGVCHLDIRLTNIYYFVDNGNNIKIKVIDWDYSNLLNHKIESGFEELCRNSSIFPDSFLIANREWHQLMLKNLKIALNSY